MLRDGAGFAPCLAEILDRALLKPAFPVRHFSERDQSTISERAERARGNAEFRGRFGKAEHPSVVQVVVIEVVGKLIVVDVVVIVIVQVITG